MYGQGWKQASSFSSSFCVRKGKKAEKEALFPLLLSFFVGEGVSVAGERYFPSATYRMATERNKTAEVCIGKVKRGRKKESLFYRAPKEQTKFLSISSCCSFGLPTYSLCSCTLASAAVNKEISPPSLPPTPQISPSGRCKASPPSSSSSLENEANFSSSPSLWGRGGACAEEAEEGGWCYCYGTQEKWPPGTWFRTKKKKKIHAFVIRVLI